MTRWWITSCSFFAKPTRPVAMLPMTTDLQMQNRHHFLISLSLHASPALRGRKRTTANGHEKAERLTCGPSG